MEELKFTPVNGRVIVSVEKEEYSLGGVALPETRDEKPEVGIILGLDKTEPHDLNERLEVGSKIIFNKFAASELKKSLINNTEDKKEYVVLTKDGILAIYNA